LVDDEPDMLDFLERVFRHDYEVVRADCAEAALALLGQHAIDIVVTDHKMPRMTGIELLEQATPHHPHLVKILMSGYTELSDLQRAVERGQIHRYVLKPIDGESARRVVADVWRDR
jgi:response regulator RpfG family c-di-GMP phosphodiesterase